MASLANMGQTSRRFLFALFSMALCVRSESTQEDASAAFTPPKIYLQDIVDKTLPYCKVKNVSTDIAAATGYVYSHFKVLENESYANNLDCLLLIQTEPKKRLNIRFNMFDLPAKYDGEECSINYDRVYIYNSADITFIWNNLIQPNTTLCGGMGKFPNDFQSLQNMVTVRFISDGKTSKNMGFEFIYTPFEAQSELATDCFNCHDKDMCIPNELLCNGVKNCNDDSDELPSVCDKKASNFFERAVDQYGLVLVIVVIAVIGFVILIFFFVCIFCCCCRKKRSEKEKSTSSAAAMHQAAAAARPKPYNDYHPSPNRFATPSSPPMAESYGAPPYSESLQSSVANGMNGVGGGHGGGYGRHGGHHGGMEAHSHQAPQPHHHYQQQSHQAPQVPQAPHGGGGGGGYYGYQQNGGGGGHHYHGYPNPSSGMSSFNGSVKYHPGHHPDSVSLPSNISRSYHSQSHSGHSDV